MRHTISRTPSILFATVIAFFVVAPGVTVDNGMSTQSTQSTNNVTTTTAGQNPLLEKWNGPYGGVPPFDRVQGSQFKPALEAAMAENLSEVERLASSNAPPNFENTIAALERTGHTLDRVETIYGIWGSTM